MLLEFKLYELKEESRLYKKAVIEAKGPNEFIIVGEEMLGKDCDCFKVHQMGKEGLKLIGGLDIVESAFLARKEDLILKADNCSYESTEMDIPKEYLTMEIIENIQRLNA
jgi:hypothetical protein